MDIGRRVFAGFALGDSTASHGVRAIQNALSSFFPSWVRMCCYELIFATKLVLCS